MLTKIVGWLAYSAVVAGLIFIGWKEPLRYRFLSPGEIAKIEHPQPPATPPPEPPPATPKPGAWMNDAARTKLDPRPSATPYPSPPR